ncbi:MAG: acid phosphatase [Myxococcota bacterium]|nr:acid phosphatase [Myxococcota bacterium]
MRTTLSQSVAAGLTLVACSSGNDAVGTGARDAATAVPPAESGSPATAESGSGASTDGGATVGDEPSVSGLARVNHIVVVVLENWSFDSLYGEFAGAEGLANAGSAAAQIDPATGQPYATLPQTEPYLPQTLPNAPFALDPFLNVGQKTTMDLTTKFYAEQQQIHGGKMDLFVALSSVKGLTMGYFHTADLPVAAEAQKYTLCDHFFHGVYGGSLQNHIFLISAAVASFPSAPASMKAVLDASGNPTKDPTTGKSLDGPLTPDGYVVGTVFSVNSPHPAVPANQLVPSQTMPTIGDRLSEKGVDWAWYAGGWNDALGGVDAGRLFQYHHQPFAYFANYADGTPGRAAHLKDEVEFLAAAKAGTLPAVSFVKPVGIDNEHPNYTDVISGEAHAMALIDAVRNGPAWSNTAIIVTYDEHGGFWDHVSPPGGDRWGPGTRIPTVIISPFAKAGFVDKTMYDTTSITALIEHRWNLAALGTRDAVAADLTNAFDFTK